MMRCRTLCFAAAVFAAPVVLACDSEPDPCANYYRMARAVKRGALVQYCLNRKGRPVGPYLCQLQDGSGGVIGNYREGMRHGSWTFMGNDGVVIRKEQWREDEKTHVEELNPELPPLPAGMAASECDGHILRWAPRKP